MNEWIQQKLYQKRIWCQKNLEVGPKQDKLPAHLKHFSATKGITTKASRYKGQGGIPWWTNKRRWYPQQQGGLHL